MNKKIRKILFILFLVFQGNLQAQEPMDYLENQLDLLELHEVNSVIGSSDTAFEVDFQDIIYKAVAGELDLSIPGLINSFLKMIFREVYENVYILKNLVVLCVLSALLKNLTESFKNKSVGEIGFYISYIALVMVLFSSFRMAVSILESFVISLSEFITASVPVITSLLIMSGNVTGGYVFNSILYFSAGFLTSLIRTVFIPMIIITSTLQIINYLTENDTLKNLSELMKKLITWSIKGVSVIFMSVITIQRISSPIINNFAMKTAKTAVGVVPVVGDVLTGAVDTVMYWIQACKSGVLVAVLITVIAFCLIPCLKLAALIFIYKLTAALIQPICDKRIVSCIDIMGSYTAIMLSCGALVVVMFVFSVMMMLSF